MTSKSKVANRWKGSSSRMGISDPKSQRALAVRVWKVFMVPKFCLVPEIENLWTRHQVSRWFPHLQVVMYTGSFNTQGCTLRKEEAQSSRAWLVKVSQCNWGWFAPMFAPRVSLAPLITTTSATWSLKPPKKMHPNPWRYLHLIDLYIFGGIWALTLFSHLVLWKNLTQTVWHRGKLCTVAQKKILGEGVGWSVIPSTQELPRGLGGFSGRKWQENDSGEECCVFGTAPE